MKTFKQQFFVVLSFIVTIFIILVIYRNSFNSAFFQDDRLALQMGWHQNILERVPSANHYRPIPLQIFYGANYQLFRLNPWGFHLVEFFVFILTLGLIYEFCRALKIDRRSSLLAMFFYGVNISLFANFFWIANSQFVIGSFFIIGAVACLIDKRKSSLILGIVAYVFALLSNEMSVVVPLLVFSTMLYLKSINRKVLFSLGFITLAYLVIKIRYLGMPLDSDYKMSFGMHAISTFRWYVLRALNLPEGVRFGGNPLMIVSFLSIVGILLVSILKKILFKENLRILAFGISWFVIGLLPFVFLPGHISAHYLSVAMVGIGIVYSKSIHNKLVLPLMFSYLILTMSGLHFLSLTHWIILKNTGPIGKF